MRLQMNVIIFSKDRPLQLDGLLKSYANHAPFGMCETKVIWTGSSQQYKDAYSNIPGENNIKGLSFIEENLNSSFKEQVLENINAGNEFTMFLVDDIVFKAPFTLLDNAIQLLSTDQSILCCSLRLNSKINYCYPTNSIVRPPILEPFGEEALIFNWVGAEGDWGYPMSLDGHVFRTEKILKILNMINFNNPNTMEANLATLVNCGFLNSQCHMTCYQESKLFNIPANRVQNTFANRHASQTTVEQLLDIYNKGKRMNVETYCGFSNNAPHVELPIVLK